MKQILSTDKAPAAIGPYSQGVLAGGFYFFSGQIPLHPVTGELVGRTVQEQAEQVFKNKKKMNKAEKKFNKAHLNRVKEQKCDPGLTIGFSGILYNLERAADNCVSIAEEALDNTGFVQLGEDAREFAMDAVAESVALGDK